MRERVPEEDEMYSPIVTFIDQLDSAALKRANVISWSCPVPYFGEIAASSIATVGINPSNLEFMNSRGIELTGNERRFPTLTSFSKSRWADVEACHIREIVSACQRYFDGRPYDRWFRILDRLIRPHGFSFYAGERNRACHLDLVPFATGDKWGTMRPQDQQALLLASRAGLAKTLRDSDLKLLILNGRSVVREFENLSGVKMGSSEIDAWTLPRQNGDGVMGVAYEAFVDRIGHENLDTKIKVIGYNHNLQSSFGVTAKVLSNIGHWVGDSVEGLRLK